MDARPRMRGEIDAVPVEQEGRTYFVLCDRSGLSAAQLVVSPPVMVIASQLDGTHSVLDIRDRFGTLTGGADVTSEEIDGVLRALEEACFLEGEKTRALRERLEREFLDNPVRAATSAGAAYSDDPQTLGRDLDTLLRGAPPPEEADTAGEARKAAPRGVVAPHIDYARGGASYAQVYGELAAREPPELVVVLGTSHYPTANRFVVCDKDFAVPGGTVRTDREAMAALLDALGDGTDYRAQMFVHRAEHTVELQAVWLRHVWGEAVRMLPILVGFVPGATGRERGEEAFRDPQLDALAEGLRALAATRRVLLLASADLSHVGPRFGDERPIAETFLEEVEAADRHYLAALARCDAQGALRSLRRHGDTYHVCGIGCLHVLASALEGGRGRLLGYHQAAAPEAQQAVSFAGMLFD